MILNIEYTAKSLKDCALVDSLIRDLCGCRPISDGYDFLAKNKDLQFFFSDLNKLRDAKGKIVKHPDLQELNLRMNVQDE